MIFCIIDLLPTMSCAVCGIVFNGKLNLALCDRCLVEDVRVHGANDYNANELALRLELANIRLFTLQRYNDNINEVLTTSIIAQNRSIYMKDHADTLNDLLHSKLAKKEVR